MSNSVEQQFSELSLSQEDHDQYEPEDHQDQRLVPKCVQHILRIATNNSIPFTLLYLLLLSK